MAITSIEKIKDSKLLDSENNRILSDLKTELLENFDAAQIHRTRTEMEVSVLNDTKFPTPASKYWQAVREQNVFYTELVRLSFEYRKTQVEIKKIRRKLQSEKDDLERELLQINFEENQFIAKCQRNVAKAKIREILDWSDIKKREAGQISLEDMANVDNHQLISYTKRWIKQSIAMGGSGSPAERQNLLGQLNSGILACIRSNVLDSVLSSFGPEIVAQIKEEYKDEIQKQGDKLL